MKYVLGEVHYFQLGFLKILMFTGIYILKSITI